MAADSFTEALHRLREIHDKEVLGMQAKLTELTVEKCRDSQRIEELFSKNHILREQHKVLNENIKVLENRLRAGLCDRCKVTQELAKKKQQEFETAHYLSLQQISSLTSEMNGLKEENRSLLEELKMLKCLDERNRNSKSFTPEANRSSESPQAPLMAGNQKNGFEKPSEETQEEQADHPIPEEKGLASSRMPPEEKSFQASSAELHLLDMGKYGAQKLNLTIQNQRISNQLHGTIAVLRSKGGQSGMAPTQAQTRRTSTSEAHTKGGASDFYETTGHIDSMSPHLAQKRLGERGCEAPAEGTSRFLLAKTREAMLERPQDDWEDRAAMVDALLYMREHGYRGTMIHPNHRDRLHYILSRQNQGIRSPQSPDDILKSQRKESLDEGELSLLQVLKARWKNTKHQENQPKEQEWDEKDAKYIEKEQREADEEEVTPDKPLDLSDSKRGHQGHLSDRKDKRRMYESYIPSPLFSSKSSPPTRTSSTDTVFAGGQEIIRGPSMSLDTKHNRDGKTCSNTEDLQDTVMEPKTCVEMDRESLGKKSSRGQKRERGSDPGGDLEHGKDAASALEDEEEEDDMSYSETETESTQHAVPGLPRDAGTKEKLLEKARWSQKAPQGSKKSVKKKKKVLNYAAESEASQEGDQDETTFS